MGKKRTQRTQSPLASYLLPLTLIHRFPETAPLPYPAREGERKYGAWEIEAGPPTF